MTFYYYINVIFHKGFLKACFIEFLQLRKLSEQQLFYIKPMGLISPLIIHRLLKSQWDGETSINGV